MIITQEIEFTPSIKQLAQEITELTDKEQVLLLFELNRQLDGYHLAMQMQNMSDTAKENRVPIAIYRSAQNFVYQLNDYLNGEDNEY